MKKNKGFVFLETIIVISVLSLTLMLIFASFSFILRKSKERNYYDTTDIIYKTGYIKNIMESYKPINVDNEENGVLYYMKNNIDKYCKQMGEFDSYVCDLKNEDYDSYLNQVKLAFEVEKIYYINPSKISSSEKRDEWLYMFDATTIDYLINMGVLSNSSVNADYILIKYKKIYDNGDYEIFHSSMEVNS